MKWENLNDEKCPCCGNPIADGGNGLITCTKCKFVIEKRRMEQIKKNRGKKPEQVTKHYWQNLHLGKCVICAGNLKPIRAHGSLIGCSTQGCPFKIGKRRLEEILENPSHSANKFKEKAQA